MVTEKGHHQPLNSTILHKGFYLRMDEQEEPNSRVYIEGMREVSDFVYDQALNELILEGVADNYGRLTVERDAILKRMMERYQTEADNLTELFYRVLLVEDRICLPDWTKIYPHSIRGLKLPQLERRLYSELPWAARTDINEPLFLDLSWMSRDGASIDVYHLCGNTRDHYTLEISTHNAFGNRVSLVLQSNTGRMNHILRKLDSAVESIHDLSLVLGRCSGNDGGNLAEFKLLCSLIIDPQKERERTP